MATKFMTSNFMTTTLSPMCFVPVGKAIAPLRRGIAAGAFAALGLVFAVAVADAQGAKPPGEQPTLLGQYGDWGAYKANSGGNQVCFAIAKPASAVTEPVGRSRGEPYLFISTRPAEKVRNEVSTVVGYPQKANANASATIGATVYAMYVQNDGAWIRNAGQEAQMVETMRKGSDIVIRSESARGTKTIDTYSLKGISEALDKVAQECR